VKAVKIFLIINFLLVILLQQSCSLNPVDSGTGSITGVIYDYEGNCIADAVVNTQPPTKSVNTNIKGIYKLENITPGNYFVISTKTGYDTSIQNASVESGKICKINMQLNYTLSENTGSVYGTVTDTSGNPLSLAYVSTLPSSKTTYTDMNGNYKLLNILPGNYTLKASKNGYDSNEINIEIEKGSLIKVDFQLKRSYSGHRLMVLDTKENCIQLTINNAITINNLTAGEKYNVSVKTTDIKNIPFKGVYFLYENINNEVNFVYVSEGKGFNFLPNNSNRQMILFIADWINSADNIGKFNISISGPTESNIVLDARDDCKILIENFGKIISDLTPGYEYVVTLSTENIQNTSINGAFYAYENEKGEITSGYISTGDSLRFIPSNSKYQFSAFLTDRDNKFDNIGKVNILIK
jgi:hypothetical protein